MPDPTDRQAMTDAALGVTGDGDVHPAEERLGALAYAGYFNACNGRSLVSGDALPTWGKQSQEIRRAWVMAAREVQLKTLARPNG